MHVLPDISFSPQYVVTDCDAAERESEMWYISSYVYGIEFWNKLHNFFFPIYVFYLSPVEMLSLHPFQG